MWVRIILKNGREPYLPPLLPLPPFSASCPAFPSKLQGDLACQGRGDTLLTRASAELYQVKLLDYTGSEKHLDSHEGSSRAARGCRGLICKPFQMWPPRGPGGRPGSRLQSALPGQLREPSRNAGLLRARGSRAARSPPGPARTQPGRLARRQPAAGEGPPQERPRGMVAAPRLRWSPLQLRRMGDPEANVMARPLRAPLRRSFSDHIRDSTARALDVIWKNTRDRRLAGEGWRAEGEDERFEKQNDEIHRHSY